MSERAGEDAMKAVATDRKRRRRSLAQWLMDVTGNEWGGTSSPPLSNHKMYVKDDGVHRVFSMQDDGGFVGIGYPDEWHVIMRTEAARAFAWWTFRLWLWDLFGLRQRIYYMALHRHVRGVWLWRPYKHPKPVRRSSYEEWRTDHAA